MAVSSALSRSMAASALSATRKAGSTSARWKYSRNTSMQKEWIVLMPAYSAASACARKRTSCAEARVSALMSEARISAAAARVKVTISILPMSAPSSIKRSTRSTSTVVLPDPAAAARSRLVCRASMASRCSLVHCMTFILRVV